jgi:catechol 2,3-dioxygenase-like lactoylglutathione lyase family enzyme
MGDTRGDHWPAGLPVARVRVARPTDRLEALRQFYGHGLGLVELGSFEGHAGYSGVFFGLPDAAYHLEFTQHEAGSPCPAPSKDNLLVLYFASASEVDRLAARLADLGYPAVEPENPYWATAVASVTVEDPDGWRVVLVKPGIQGTTSHAAPGPGSSR